MSFDGFTAEDFATFQIEGLECRMSAIRERIQPKFRAIGEALTDELSVLSGNEMYVHIAKHARRTVNPPNDTWMAFCHHQRGYKKHPHFQVGLFDDHLFIWLAYIYELPNKKQIAAKFLDNLDTLQQTIPEDYIFSFNHMKKDSVAKSSLTAAELKAYMERFQNVKKAELLIGKHIVADDPLLLKPQQLLQEIKDTFATLVPLYRLSMS